MKKISIFRTPPHLCKQFALSICAVFFLTNSSFAQDSLDFSQQVETRKVLNNSLANSSFTPYRAFKTRTLASLSGFKTKVVATDKYGGRKDKSAKATGFYYTKKINGRWWAIDPEGHLFLHNALNAVSMAHQTVIKPLLLITLKMKAHGSPRRRT